MHSFASEIRDAARGALPDTAFLRRDRNEDGLYVTDALARSDPSVCANALHAAGFVCLESAGLLRLHPGWVWLIRLEERFPVPPDTFCEALFRFSGLPPEGESIALFTRGLRVLDGESDHSRFDRHLRQRSAQCLRLNRMTPQKTHGGGLYACALVRYYIEEERK